MICAIVIDRKEGDSVVADSDQARSRQAVPGWLNRFHANPLFAEVADSRPYAVRRLFIAFLTLLAFSFSLSLLSWLFHWRLISTVMLVLSLLAAAIPLISLPLLGARRVTRTLSDVADGEITLPAIPAYEIARGFSWRTFFHARWSLCLALALFPALLLHLFRLDLANFTIWQASALNLGSAADPARTALLLPGGGIPYGRLILRMLSLAALLPMLAYFAAVTGTLSAFFRPEAGRAMLIALLFSLSLSLALLAGWQDFSLLPSFAGWAEGLRLLLYLFFLLCLWGLIALFNRVIARQLGE